MSEQSWTSRILTKLGQWISNWLSKLRQAVFGAGRDHPNPSAVLDLQADWNIDVVDRLLPELYEAAGDAWATVTNQPYPTVQEFVLAQLQATRNLLVRIPHEVYKQIFDQISEGVRNGESNAQIADRIDQVLFYTGSEWWASRSKVISNTEVHRAWQSGILAGAMQAQPQTGPGWVKEWHTELDGRERDTHKKAHGQQRRLGDHFLVGGFPLMYPGDPSGPADEVINCVVGDTAIAANGLVGAYRYWNSGPLVQVASANGTVLTVSPNHPILTVKGWVPARQVDKGDYLISAAGSDLLSRSQPNIQAEPATATEVFDTLAQSGRRHWVSGLDVNFHGDRPHGDVEIVFSYRALGFGIDAAHVDHFQQLCFTCANAASFSGGPSFQRGVAGLDAPRGLVRFSNLVHALIGAHARPFESFGVTATTDLDAIGYEPSVDGDPVHAEVEAQLAHGYAGFVALDEIVDVKFDIAHEGYLYSFETVSGVYLANAAVSHNCRCDMIIKEPQT